MIDKNDKENDNGQESSDFEDQHYLPLEFDEDSEEEVELTPLLGDDDEDEEETGEPIPLTKFTDNSEVSEEDEDAEAPSKSPKVISLTPKKTLVATPVTPSDQSKKAIIAIPAKPTANAKSEKSPIKLTLKPSDSPVDDDNSTNPDLPKASAIPKSIKLTPKKTEVVEATPPAHEKSDSDTGKKQSKDLSQEKEPSQEKPNTIKLTPKKPESMDKAPASSVTTKGDTEGADSKEFSQDKEITIEKPKFFKLTPKSIEISEDDSEKTQSQELSQEKEPSQEKPKAFKLTPKKSKSVAATPALIETPKDDSEKAESKDLPTDEKLPTAKIATPAKNVKSSLVDEVHEGEKSLDIVTPTSVAPKTPPSEPPPAKPAVKIMNHINFEDLSLGKTTTGQLLQEARVKSNLSLNQVEQITKIKSAFIEAIERDDFSVLPPFVYVSAYIKTLCSVYHLPSEAAPSLVENLKEQTQELILSEEILQHLEQEKQVNLNEEQKLKKFFYITLAALGLIIIVAAAVLGYHHFMPAKKIDTNTAQDTAEKQTDKINFPESEFEQFISPQPITMTEFEIPER